MPSLKPDILVNASPVGMHPHVDEIPVLGSGKLALKEIKDLALETVGINEKT